jgi:hypothetical protein
MEEFILGKFFKRVRWNYKGIYTYKVFIIGEEILRGGTYIYKNF